MKTTHKLVIGVALAVAFTIGCSKDRLTSEQSSITVPYSGGDHVTLGITNAPVLITFHIRRDELAEVITNKAETFYFCLGDVPCVSKPSASWHVYLATSPSAALTLDSPYYIGDLTLPDSVKLHLSSTRVAFAIHRSLLQEVIDSGGDIVATFIQTRRSFDSQDQESIDISKIGFEKRPLYIKR